VVTVTFAQLGFTPANGSTYYVDVTATDASGTSVPSGEVTFVYAVPPSPPTGLKVS
jgi:ABC-type transporter Mla subunit MlaD